MRSSVITLLTIAASALAAPAVQQQHHHHNQQKRAVVTQIVYVDSNGNTVSGPSASAHPIVATVSTSATPAQTTEASSASSEATTSSKSSSLSSSSSTEAASTESSSSGSSGDSSIAGDLSAFSDPTKEFEDGVYSCDTVPTGQGVIAVDWISGLNGGWTTIMNEDGDTSSTCKDGYYCSYACQAGMSKTQWPSEHPSTVFPLVVCTVRMVSCTDPTPTTTTCVNGVQTMSNLTHKSPRTLLSVEPTTQVQKT
ncbi:protein UTH1 [Lodderomyces elongisporus NRRL YB-4239]|uniref:Protein UTH1 n=1 Tax=Lodderomyces elongisporus (strain ATCC 11503 / CBS 2605 / JCM 1781 / NBRC 1676 / NRRL YB-4239) TaxID=379508 RepID=A5E1F3_LODEL|nr:protein UTH1 [Lodderomyces elongisporus NRRL YB-4239]